MQRFAKIAAFVAVCAAAVWPAGSVHTVSSCLVATGAGAVQGLDRGTACAFLGIPFAAPPIGGLRWKPPQAANPWAPAVLTATAAPPSCAQLSAATGLPSGSEDCLKLNIWMPNPAPLLSAPVMVWFHSGGFANSSANFAGHNGQNLASLSGAIVVEPNYRLGPFGFLGHSALSSEGEGAGNYGLLDQRAALAWVHDHISAFGGDPDNVTIAGQSAGGHSVGLHLVSPGSAGLFHRAIMQSGYASFRWRTAAEAASQGDEFAARLGCADADLSQLLTCLRSKSTNQVLLAHPTVSAEQIAETGRTQWTPVVDGNEIPDQPRELFERGVFSRVPVLLGANRDEGWTFVNRSFPSGLTTEQYETAVTSEFAADAPVILAAYPAVDFVSPKDALVQLVGDAEYVCEARRMARLIERTRAPAFVYSFEYEVDAVVTDRVVHGLELNFVFGNNFGPPLFANYVLSPDDLTLSRSMSAYWTRFAASGDPNSDDPAVVHWPAFKHPAGHGNGSDKHLVFDTTVTQGLRLGGQRCDFWERFSFRSVTGSVPASTR